jgi:hypothetical protein
MRDETDDDLEPTADDPLVRLLVLSGPRPPAARDADPLGDAVARALHAAQRRRRWRPVAGLALAAGTVLALFVLLSGGTSPAPTPVAALAQVEAVGGEVLLTRDGVERPLQVGDRLGVGDRLRPAQDGGTRLAFRGAELRLAGGADLTVAATALELAAGAIYVDTGAFTGTAVQPVIIRTDLGTVTHRGTQFVVRRAPEGLRVAVREGAVFLRRADDARMTASADAASAAWIEIDADGAVRERRGPRHGEPWSDFGNLARPLAIDGRSAFVSIEQAARELGYAVDWDASATRTRARASILRAAGPLPATRALEVIDAATSLRVAIDAQGGRVYVSQGRL